MVKFKLEVVKYTYTFNHSKKAASQKYGVHSKLVQLGVMKEKIVSDFILAEEVEGKHSPIVQDRLAIPCVAQFSVTQRRQPILERFIE